MAAKVFTLYGLSDPRQTADDSRFGNLHMYFVAEKEEHAERMRQYLIDDGYMGDQCRWLPPMSASWDRVICLTGNEGKYYVVTLEVHASGTYRRVYQTTDPDRIEEHIKAERNYFGPHISNITEVNLKTLNLKAWEERWKDATQKAFERKQKALKQQIAVLQRQLAKMTFPK